MKKLLLFSCFFTAITAQAQIYWEKEATAQPTPNTGVSSISIVDANVTWLNMMGGTATADLVRYAKTVDGGTVWSTGAVDLGAPDLRIGNIHGVSDMVAYASVYPTDLTRGGV